MKNDPSGDVQQNARYGDQQAKSRLLLCYAAAAVTDQANLLNINARNWVIYALKDIKLTGKKLQ